MDGRQHMLPNPECLRNTHLGTMLYTFTSSLSDITYRNDILDLILQHLIYYLDSVYTVYFCVVFFSFGRMSNFCLSVRNFSNENNLF